MRENLLFCRQQYNRVYEKARQAPGLPMFPTTRSALFVVLARRLLAGLVLLVGVLLAALLSVLARLLAALLAMLRVLLTVAVVLVVGHAWRSFRGFPALLIQPESLAVVPVCSMRPRFVPPVPRRARESARCLPGFDAV
jgi:hypothetical protein